MSPDTPDTSKLVPLNSFFCSFHVTVNDPPLFQALIFVNIAKDIHTMKIIRLYFRDLFLKRKRLLDRK